LKATFPSVYFGTNLDPFHICICFALMVFHSNSNHLPYAYTQARKCPRVIGQILKTGDDTLMNWPPLRDSIPMSWIIGRGSPIDTYERRFDSFLCDNSCCSNFLPLNREEAFYPISMAPWTRLLKVLFLSWRESNRNPDCFSMYDRQMLLLPSCLFRRSWNLSQDIY